MPWDGPWFDETEPCNFDESTRFPTTLHRGPGSITDGIDLDKDDSWLDEPYQGTLHIEAPTDGDLAFLRDTALGSKEGTVSNPGFSFNL